jgi:hypothetical protein
MERMTMGMQPDPKELQQLVDRVKVLWGNLSIDTQRKLINAQRRSWVIGELRLEHPELTAQQAEEIVAKVEKSL